MHSITYWIPLNDDTQKKNNNQDNDLSAFTFVSSFLFFFSLIFAGHIFACHILARKYSRRWQNNINRNRKRKANNTEDSDYFADTPMKFIRIEMNAQFFFVLLPNLHECCRLRNIKCRQQHSFIFLLRTKAQFSFPTFQDILFFVWHTCVFPTTYHTKNFPL